MTELTYQVTYYNSTLDRRCVLISGLDIEHARAVLERFSNPAAPLYFMPDCQIEVMLTDD